MRTVTSNLSKQTTEKLRHLALRYGFSIPELSARILEEISSEFPPERLADYQHPERLRASLKRALADFKAGRISETL